MEQFKSNFILLEECLKSSQDQRSPVNSVLDKWHFLLLVFVLDIMAVLNSVQDLEVYLS